MTHYKEQWGEKTIFRAETGWDEKHGLEMILRLIGDPRPIEKEELIGFLNDVIKELNGEKTGLKNFRSVKFGSSKIKKVKRAWTTTHAQYLKDFIQDLSDSLTDRGRKDLMKALHDAVQKIDK